MLTSRQQSWCVYETTLKGRVEATRSVCESDEWEAMLAAKPGLHTLIMAGWTSPLFVDGGSGL